jgi:hypothetical protein
MSQRRAALAVVLALCAVWTKPATAQQAGTTEPKERKFGTLGQNFPNPFPSDTRIPFTVDACAGSTPRVVSVRIYNVISQVVGVPVLEGDVGANRAMSNLKVPCGNYVAYWSGKAAKSGRVVAPGVYVFELTIDGQRQTKKMVLAKPQ